MLTLNATDVRKEWSLVMDTVVREKPQFIRRTRDYMMLADVDFLKILLETYVFYADEFVEDDGSITLTLNEIDLVTNGIDENDAKKKMALEILEYAEEFYNEFNLYSVAPNRKSHIPYVFKALILDDAEKIGDIIICQPGEN